MHWTNKQSNDFFMHWTNIGSKEIKKCVVAFIKKGSTVVSDGWKATISLPWRQMGYTFEYCIHSRKDAVKKVKDAAKDGKKRSLFKGKRSTDKKTQKKITKDNAKWRENGPLWVNKKGFHSNDVESDFSRLKRWARKRNSGSLPKGEHLELYLWEYTFRRNLPAGMTLNPKP